MQGIISKGKEQSGNSSTLSLRFCVLALLICSISFSSKATILGKDDKYHVDIENKTTPELLRDTIKKWQDDLNAQELPKGANGSYGYYRFEQDRTYLRKSLKTEGYYRANVEGKYDEESKTAVFKINLGQQYKFGNVHIVMESNDSGINSPETKILNTKSGDAALTRMVLLDEAAIKKWLEKNNCLFKHSTTHKASINHLKYLVNITYHVTVSSKTSFGKINFTGNKTVADLYLQRRVKLKAGDCFKRSRLNSAKLALQRSGLIEKAEAVIPNTLADNGIVPITFKIKEKLHHSLKAGASFSTDIGSGVTAGWEHRNLFAHGEKLTAKFSAATLEQRISAQLNKPYFLREDQRLKLSSSISRQDNDAYQTTGINFSVGVERNLGNKWVAGATAKYGFEQIKDQNNTENVALLSLPLFASQDTRNDPLNPTSGWAIQLNSAPSVDTLDINTLFIKNRISGSYYQPIGFIGQPIIAIRVATGSVLGSSSDTIPATERFYTGGGGSIRGYGYKLAGPLDAQNNPVGGRSFVELSTELRMRIAKDYGAVIFLDGGNSFEAPYPDFNDGLLWGVGVGARYYTSIGPLRMDVAIPLDKRAGVDDSFQLYFSIGQAF